MAGRVVVPIHNEKGELIAYAGRSIDDAEPRYKLPADFKKSLVLFNLHRAKGQGRVVLVEGFFGTMKVHQAGFPSVLGLMGSSLSEEQEKLLAEHFREAVPHALMVTRRAGRRRWRLPRGSRGECSCGQWTSRQIAQPDRLSSEEIRAILSSL